MSDPRQALLDRLNAERYGPSLWWESDQTKREVEAVQPDELAGARRRRVLLENYIGDERETG